MIFENPYGFEKEMSSIFCEEIICQATRKIDRKRCTHKAYYLLGNTVLCGVHSKKYSRANNRILLSSSSTRQSTRTTTPGTSPLPDRTPTSFFPEKTCKCDTLTFTPKFTMDSCTSPYPSPSLCTSSSVFPCTSSSSSSSTQPSPSPYSFFQMFIYSFLSFLVWTCVFIVIFRNNPVDYFTISFDAITQWIAESDNYFFERYPRGCTSYANMSTISPFVNSLSRDL